MVPAGPGHSASQTVTKKVERPSSPLDSQDGEDLMRRKMRGVTFRRQNPTTGYQHRAARGPRQSPHKMGRCPIYSRQHRPIFEKDAKSGRAQARRGKKTSVTILENSNELLLEPIRSESCTVLGCGGAR
jgi:hypothetical protein